MNEFFKLSKLLNHKTYPEINLIFHKKIQTTKDDKRNLTRMIKTKDANLYVSNNSLSASLHISNTDVTDIQSMMFRHDVCDIKTELKMYTSHESTELKISKPRKHRAQD